MRKIVKLIQWFLILVTILGMTGYVYLRQSLAEVAGVIKLPGLRTSVEIIRDTDAIPHIYAQNKADAFFSLGYVHAQDRLWQMEFQRRLGQGRLSEFLGEMMVPADSFLRTVGIYRSALNDWKTYPRESREIIDAYVAGINAFLGTHSGSQLPPEFTFLGVKPELWSGPDVLMWSKMLAWNLSGNFGMELLRTDIIQAVGAERARQLLPDYSEGGPDIVLDQSGVGNHQAIMTAAKEVRTLMGVATLNSSGIGSNSWVVDGTKSVTGKPILANDPHLGTSIPSIWYLAHISAQDLDVIGATIPGLPAVVIGRNQSIAWGLTNLMADAQDLFRERLDPSGSLAEFKGQMEPMQLITETIKVKGQPDIQHLVRLTRHGPLISDAINAAEAKLPDEQHLTPLQPLALQWAGLDQQDTTIEALLLVNQARNWDQFLEALQLYDTPPQSFVYADMEGNIGYHAAGRIPIRRETGDGLLPKEGWSGTYEWPGWIPFDDLPHAFNPPDHLVVTANNRPVPDSYPFYLGGDWVPPYRAQRITDLLESKVKVSLDDQVPIQGDTTSLLARELLPELLPQLNPQDADQRQALDRLTSWDGKVQGDSAAAAIFEAWYQKLPHAIIGDELGADLALHYEENFSFASRFLAQILKERTSVWCDDVTTPGQETCNIIMNRTFQETLAELKVRLGKDMGSWRWDKLHVVVFPHQPFHNVALVNRFFSRWAPTSGDESTVNVGSFSFDDRFEQHSAAVYRQVIDLSNLNESYFIQTSGQSGHFLSSHYDDYFKDWQAMRYRKMRLMKADVENNRASTLRLEP
jgi:penicillin G amidase